MGGGKREMEINLSLFRNDFNNVFPNLLLVLLPNLAPFGEKNKTNHSLLWLD
jgi:hypothetical protein